MMDLPQTTEVDELNRVLIAVAELSVEGQGCSVESVVTLCSSFALGGRSIDHKKTIRLCSFAGLLSVGKGTVALTETGKKFLELNPTRLYELTDAQKHFVAKQLILSGPWRSRARDLFLSFSPNHSRITYEFVLSDNPLPLQYRSIVHLLRSLGVVLETDAVLSVAPRYVAPVVRLLADRHGATDEDLGKALLADRKLGAQAEEAVLEYERKRLRALGRDAEASLVRRISQLDVGAGYDIQSYDGDKPLFDYDRFIEVKASQADELRFYWTANERRVAEKLGSRYWIYFVGNFRSNQADQIAPIMIRDPANRLPDVPQLQIEASTYLVTQLNELSLEPINQQDIRGFLL
jgi:hypothetical protein